MISKLNHSWQRRFAAGAALAITAALTFMVAAARPDAGNPILGTIKASVVSSTPTTMTIAVKGEWNWLSHNGDCNYDRAATGAGLAWGDRNGADNSRSITSIVRNGNVVTVTMPAMTWNVGDRVFVAGVSNATFNGGPFTVTAVSGTTVKFAQTAANATSSGGKIEDLDVFNGWELFKSATSNGWIGTQLLEKDGSGATINPIDREVHPTDRGNFPADGKGPLPGALVSNGAPVNQARFDPGMNGTTGLSTNYAQWKGGCGREPVNPTAISITSATENASKVVTLTLGAPGNAFMTAGDSITVAGVANNNYNGNYTLTGKVGANQITYTSGKSALPASSGGTVTDNTLGANQSGPGCLEWCGDPWGSWGYDTFDSGSYTLGFTHTYLKQIPDPLHPGQTISGLPEKICVNFYDVHGGGTTASAFQLVNGTKEVQVDGNGDNSIETNSFNVSDGANCTSISGPMNPSVVTNASPNQQLGSLPVTLTDSATLSNSTNATGKMAFDLYGPDDATCAHSIFHNEVTVSGDGSYAPSAGYTLPQDGSTVVGTYRWIANYLGDSNNAATTNGCNGANESTVITRANPAVVTSQSVIPQDNATVSGGVVTPTGSVTFKLFMDDNACSGSSVYSDTEALDGNGHAKTSNSGTGPNGYTATGNHTWYWKVDYSGDGGSNQPSSSNCIERFTIKNS